MIFNHIIEIYIIIYASIIIHEIAHILTAMIIGIEITKIHIGDRLYSIHIGKIYFSPLLSFNTYVCFSVGDLLKKSNIEKAIFFSVRNFF